MYKLKPQDLSRFVYLFKQYDFPFNVYKGVAKTNANEQTLLVDQDRGRL